MTKSKLLGIFGVAALGLTLVYTLFAQMESEQRPTAPASVALVDIVFILSQNAVIDQKLSELNDSYKELIQEAEQEREQIKTLNDELPNYALGSAKYREIQQQMLSMASNINAKQILLVKEATEARMKVVRDAYELTRRHTERVARYLGMTIVLNYDRTPLPETIPGLLTSPQQYEQYMMSYSQFIASKAVVWANSSAVDITSLVLNEIQKADPSTVPKKKEESGMLISPSFSDELPEAEAASGEMTSDHKSETERKTVTLQPKIYPTEIKRIRNTRNLRNTRK